MSPKSKAKELIATFLPFAHRNEADVDDGVSRSRENAKKCARMAIREVLKAIKSITGAALTQHDKEIIAHWKSVKQEIKKL